MTTPPTGKSGKRSLRIGKYEVLYHIASGGMGSVYKAIDSESGREVALKVLPADLAANPKVSQRFRREALASSRLRHDNVVAIYEFGEAAGTHFLALEFVEGANLQDFIDKNGPLKPDLARDLLKQAAKALGHLHSQGIVHRDIKPSNFLLTQQDGHALLKLTDLGLALRGDENQEARVTQEGTTVGTVDYMSPEQAHDSHSADVRSDIYSLGCTFYHMLGGRAPFHEGSIIERLTRHVTVEPMDIRQLNPEVPDDLKHVLDRMLKKKPDQRYQAPLEILRDLLNPDQIDLGPRLEPLDPPPPRSERRRAAPPPPTEPKKKAATQEAKERPAIVKARPETDEPHVDETVRLPRKRPREKEPARPPKPEKQPANNQWVVVTGIAAAVLLVVGAIAVALFAGRGDPPRKASQDATTSTRHVPARPRDGDGQPVFPQAVAPAEKPRVDPGPGSVFGPGVPVDAGRLRQDFEGPLGLPEIDGADVQWTVGRLLPKSATSFPTLAEAMTAAQPGTRTVINLADNGPIFLPELPPMIGRSLVLRGAKGFMPLLVWEANPEKNSTLFAMQKGNLTLIDLEIVVQCKQSRGDESLAFVRLAGGDFLAEHCVFAAAGKHPRGFVVARLDAETIPAKCRLTRCFARGNDLQMLRLAGQGWDAQIDDSLLVGGTATCVESDCPPQAPLTVRVLRSTIVTAKHFLQLQTPANLDVQPTVRVKLLDSLLAHTDPTHDGSVLAGTGQMETFNMTWRAANVVYAGWHKLLSASNQSILGADLDTWRKQWSTPEGDKAIADVWPRHLPPQLEEVDAAYFTPKGSPLYFAAVSHPGLIGAPLAVEKGYTPRAGWLGLAGQRPSLPAVPLPGGEPFAVPLADDGLYHGEAIALTWEMDLGQLLEKRFAEYQNKIAPRVVIDLTGTGDVVTSAIRVKGFDLVLQVTPPVDSKEKPLTLAPRSTTADKRALIDVEAGNLDLINVRILCDNKAVAMPQTMVRVEGGAFRLFGCSIQGPLDKGPENFQRLIEFHCSGKGEPAAAYQLACAQSVLQSGKQVLAIVGGGARVRLQQCVVLAAQDVLEIAPGLPVAGRCNLQLLLENNTFAARRNVVHVSEPPPAAEPVVEPILVLADKNLFVDPFVEMPRTSCLVDLTPRALSLGLLQWQGDGNAFDERLGSFVAGGPKQFADWQGLWGKAGERAPVFVTWPPQPASTFALSAPQLERLQPPPQWAEYGATLSRLGIAKKK